MEPLITLDTASTALVCWLCQEKILAGDDLTILGTGLSYWPAHRNCFRHNQLPLWYQ
jgi:hypothetical protein